MNSSSFAVEAIFFATLLITFGAAVLGRKHSQSHKNGLAKESLNKWLIGLSAGATANSGFVVTGAVGLGYSFGPQWLFLPLSWFLGDLIFWKFCAAKLNSVGRISQATTLSELLKSGLTGRASKMASILTTLIIVICLGGYTSAQWLAGQKFVAGAFDLSTATSLALFSGLIVAYTSIGGFRGSVYADTVQAIIRLIGTALALIAIVIFAFEDQNQFMANWQAAGEGFSQWLPGNTLSSIAFFCIGYAFAAFGFSLGQPHLVSRYLAGKSPEETQAAQWIYIGFVQFTWISMTLFGVLLRGIMPDISDPEAGLSIFFYAHFGSIITGIIVADIFATIAATSNSLLIAMSQAVVHDLISSNFKVQESKKLKIGIVIVLGGLTMLGSILLSDGTTVFSLAIASVALMASGLAAPVLIKVFDQPRNGLSLLASVFFGLAAALTWRWLDLEQMLNEAAIGITFGYIANWVVIRFIDKNNPSLHGTIVNTKERE